MKNQKLTTKSVVLTGMLTAVLSVLSIIQIPMPSGVPITLQTFAVAFCGYVLGWKLGGAAAALYLVLGAIGVPVYAGMSSGFGSLFGAAGGFIFGFIPMAILCGLGIRKGFKGKAIVFGIIGLAICHLFGIIQFSIVTGNGLVSSLVMASMPYWIKDIISVIGAEIVAIAVRKALTASSVMSYGETA
ncbi:MAG: biotin transporter BioY [Fusicatenibacter sp.]|nr:biotin transporter BioY [Lachnospiraceae bacterium]MDY2937356.1 biotin transporter BioY [Fusicatenibacter sp.]